MQILRLIKLLKLQKWDNYLKFVEKLDASGFAPLVVCDDEKLSTTTVESLFTPCSLHFELREKYNLDEVAGEGDGFSKAKNLMQWLTNHTCYNGASKAWNPDDSLAILDYSFDKGFQRAICCREKAIILTDMLISLGLKAYPLCMRSMRDVDNHFTVRFFYEEQNKWIMLDPSFNVVFKLNGEPLDVYEVRQSFLEGKDVELSGYNFNNTQKCIDIYKQGFIKQCLSKLSTWNDCSIDRRQKGKRHDWTKKKEFETRLFNY